MTVWELTRTDVNWVAAMCERRRNVYFRYSSVFWRPAALALERHRPFLVHQIGRDDTVALRTEHGFLIADAADDGEPALIDDYAVEPDERWADDGRDLLLAAADAVRDRGLPGVQVVTAQADLPKVSMLRAAGLSLSDRWWVKPLQTATDRMAAGSVEYVGGPEAEVSGTGFSGVLGPAPPVYDPGGPVLVVADLDPGAALGSVETEAAALGAVLAALPLPPGSPWNERLHRRDWTVAAEWYAGTPGPVRPG